MKKLILLFLIIIANLNIFGQFEYLNSPNNVNDLLILPSGKMLAGTNQGLFISANQGNDWDSTSINTEVYKIKMDISGNIYASSSSFFKSVDQGIVWEECIDLFPDRIVNFSINDSNHIHLLVESNQALSVFRSKDLGVSWEVISNIFFYDNSQAIAYGINHNSVGNTFISYHGYGYAPGGIWFDYKFLERFNNQPPWLTVIEGLIITDIQFLNDVMYLTTWGEGISKSYDEGNTLIPIRSGLLATRIKQIITTEDIFLCLATNYVHRSLNNGDTWWPLWNGGLDPETINRIYLSDNGILYACTQNGIYFFTGELPVELTSFTAIASGSKVILNWSTASELNNYGFEIQRKHIDSDWFTIGFKAGQGTSTEHFEYIFSDDISNISETHLFYRLKQIDFDGSFSYSSTVEVELLPDKFLLEQNYPNPFNPSTKIKYSIPNVGTGLALSVTLKVYDILGNEVAALVNEAKQPGNYEVEFNANHLSSGTYFYTIIADGFFKTKKMIILK